MPLLKTRQILKPIQIDDVGAIALCRSRRARRLTLRLKADGAVSLTIPWHFSLPAALAFLDANRNWIIRKRKTLEQRKPRLVAYDGTKPISTRAHYLRLVPGQSEQIGVSIQNGQIIVKYPACQKITTPEVQTAIAGGLTEAYRIEAKQYLPHRVQELARQFGFQYQRVTIKNLKSCWGSCSRVNNINLNLHLIRLPDELIDYVILHELTHTRIHNHSPQFWQVLENILPKARSYRKQLQHYARAGFLSSVFVEL